LVLASDCGDNFVGVGDPLEGFAVSVRRVWEQHDESLEAFEKRVKAAADAARTQGFPPYER
jgi:hypothetical protein